MAKQPRKLSPLEEKINDWVNDHLVRIPAVQKILFVSHLKTMIQAGLSLVEALQVLSQEIENKRLKKVINEIKAKVESGREFSKVLSEYPKVFPPIYVSMIEAGEKAGKLEGALEQVTYQMQESHELNSKIRGALMYPAVIIVAMIGITIEIVFFVLPKLLVLFEDFDAALPLATRILIAITKFSQQYGLWLILATVILISIFVWLVRTKYPVRKVVHKINLRLPIVGKIIQKINLARFTLTMSSLLESTIPIIEAANICSRVLGNVIYRENMLKVAESLKKGESLSASLSSHPKTFPAMVTEMVMVGEKSGKTEQMLGELSSYYSNEVKSTMKNLTTIIEPIIIVIMGLAVAGIAVAVIMPMYSLAQSI